MLPTYRGKLEGSQEGNLLMATTYKEISLGSGNPWDHWRLGEHLKEERQYIHSTFISFTIC